MPTGAEKRARAPGKSRASVRAKESAEHARVSALQGALPPLSASFLPARPNRRQRTAAAAAAKDAPPGGVAGAVARSFGDLPLSRRTLDGLAAARFAELTDVQRLAIPQALAARDVLAAAPTGSGKTLAFIVPVLEALWRQKWSTYDGLGALVLAPTRELALQIFEVLRAVAKFHMISAGLVIGGKDVAYEREKIGTMNVLVATPGRLLHHMDTVAEFDCSTLQVLVLDEADRILDLGFSRTLSAILENLPKEGRQTLLFSATQTKSIKSLGRLSLQSPQYVSVTSAPRKAPGEAKGGEKEASGADGAESDGVEADNGESNVSIVGTPAGLSQSYTLMAVEDKLSILWSFIKTHLHSKVIVFLATGKQVRFVFESFCKLRPGVALLHIHGNMKQLKRTDTYDAFCRTKNAVLFATDVASRGLDFPDVEWVVQVDCPDDVSGYIHRVGRTARFRSRGRAMLFLCKGKEETFLKRLESRKLVLNQTRVNPDRITSITPRLASLVASSQELKNVAQRAFTFYLKSVYRQADKDVFNAVDVDHAAFAASLGLAMAPKVVFKNAGVHGSGAKGIEGPAKTVFGYRGHTQKEDKKRKAKAEKDAADVGDEDVDDDVLVFKKTHKPSDAVERALAEPADGEDSTLPVSRKRKRIKLDILKSGPSVNRIVFSEDGKALSASQAMHAEEDASDSGEEAPEALSTAEGLPSGIEEYASIVSKRLEKSAAKDKAREHARVRAKHAKIKEKTRVRRGEAAADAAGDSDSGSDVDLEYEDFSEALSKIAARSGGQGRDAAKNDGSSSEGDDGDSSSPDYDDDDESALEARALEIIQRRLGQ